MKEPSLLEEESLEAREKHPGSWSNICPSCGCRDAFRCDEEHPKGRKMWCCPFCLYVIVNEDEFHILGWDLT